MKMKEKKIISEEDFLNAQEVVLQNAELIIRIVSNTRFTDKNFSEMYQML